MIYYWQKDVNLVVVVYDMLRIFSQHHVTETEFYENYVWLARRSYSCNNLYVEIFTN